MSELRRAREAVAPGAAVPDASLDEGLLESRGRSKRGGDKWPGAAPDR